MSHAHATASSSSSTNFQLIINNALDKYKKRTKNDLITHPLAAQIQSCDSPSAILAVLQQQVQGLDQSRSSDERWSRWLDPTVNVIYALSSTLAAGVSLVSRSTDELLRSAHSYSSGRYFLPRMSYSLGSVSSFQCVFFLLAVGHYTVTLTYVRRPRTLGRAKTFSSTSLNGSRCSFDASKSIQNCRRRWI